MLHVFLLHFFDDLIPNTNVTTEIKIIIIIQINIISDNHENLQVDRARAHMRLSNLWACARNNSVRRT